MKTTRPDAMGVGFLVWQFGGDTCLILPILSHSVVSETQANTAPLVGTAVSARACAAHSPVQHRQTSCPAVEVPSNASLRNLIPLSLTRPRNENFNFKHRLI
jgi:hypothetical protein